MKLWLSMIIKNEEKNIKKYLYDIYDLFDDVVVVDTWSTDSSIELLNNIWIKAIQCQLVYNDERLIEARNFSIEHNTCDWILILDWDEYISREDIKKIKDMESDCFNHSVSGYFIKRLDHRYKEVFEDYKMCLINKNYVRFLFSVHACPQVYIRDNGWTWLWMNGVTLHHYPEVREYKLKYIEQLENWIKENPGCLRFYRFLWYYYFKHDKIPEAISKFKFVIQQSNYRYPVEILNSIMILSYISYLSWDTIKTFCYISLWLEYYETIKEDFEIKINFRLKKRFFDSQQKLIENPEAIIVPYEFAY